MVDQGVTPTIAAPCPSKDKKTGSQGGSKTGLVEKVSPVTVWTYSPEHLALGKVRGLITAVGYTTATFAAVETTTDPRWPGDELSPLAWG